MEIALWYSRMSQSITLDLINTGKELLLGIRSNAHLCTIGRELGRHGLFIRRNLACGDSLTAIMDSLECTAGNGAQAVIITGGIGPTPDDNVKEAVANYFGLKLIYHEAVWEHISEYYARLGHPLNEANRKICYLPEGSELLHNPYGTAPGVRLVHGETTVLMLPGPAQELKPMLTEHVIPSLCSQGYCNYGDAYLQLRSAGASESELPERLLPALAEQTGIDVAYCAHQGMVDIRLSPQHDKVSEAQLRAVADKCRLALKEDFVCYGHTSLPRVIFDQLRAHEHTLAVAESCTGGLLSNAFTDIPGASKVFKGGFICYDNDAKVQMLGIPECLIRQHGAVSAECAVAMADAAAEHLSTEYALSVTGFAGPSGGTAEHPVGTIFIGYHSPMGTWAIKMQKPGQRTQVNQRAVNRALDLMRRKLNKYQVHDVIQTA
jgi:nicotinamide-nucleotide amidase